MSAAHISTAAGLRRMLVIHQNFPGQFRHVVAALQGRADVEPIAGGNESLALNDRLRVNTWRAHHLLALNQCDMAIAPTHWQKSQFPATYQPKIQVLHEGVDAERLGPDPHARLTLPCGLRLQAGDPVVTYVSRNLEPYRGFHVFMRCLPALLRAHPGCQVLIVGGDGVSYGRAPAKAKHWREALLHELSTAEGFDAGRVHFLGRLPTAQYRRVLQVSAVHLYLTYPFVLSWSLLEALASGCAVVASDTSPVREVIRDGENGLLVDFFDGSQIVDSVQKVLVDPTGFQAMRKAAVKSVKERFAQAAGTPGYLDLMGCDFPVTLGPNHRSEFL